MKVSKIYLKKAAAVAALALTATVHTAKAQAEEPSILTSPVYMAMPGNAWTSALDAGRTTGNSSQASPASAAITASSAQVAKPSADKSSDANYQWAFAAGSMLMAGMLIGAIHEQRKQNREAMRKTSRNDTNRPRL